MLENQIANTEQSSIEQLYRLEIERLRLVNNRRARSAFVANQKGHIQAPDSTPCDSFFVTNPFEAPFADFLAR